MFVVLLLRLENRAGKIRARSFDRLRMSA